MQKKLTFLLLSFFALLLSPFLFASDKGKLENSLLWEVSGNGLEESSYLFGTIHMICPDDYFWSEAFENAFQQSKQLFLELDLSDPELLSQAQTMMMSSSEDDEKWTDKLTEDQLNSIKAYFSKKMGLPENMVESQLLGRMSLTGVYQLMILQSLTCQIPDSYDMNILKKAQEANMEIHGLEDLEVQLAVFKNADEEMFIKSVVELAQDPSKSDETFAKLIEAYKEQDLNTLHELIVESPDTEAMGSAILEDRNKNWIPVMQEAMKKMPSFFAFGAGHLSGEVGIIQLLRDQGYTVKAVK